MLNNPGLEISFPKSDQDHRLQLVEVNGSIFAIIHSPLESLGPIRLECEDWSLVLLTPIKSKSNILISGINVFCLNEIASEEGNVNIHASNRLVKFSNLIKPQEKLCEMGERGVLQLDDDPGAFLYFYKLFSAVLADIRSGTPDSFSEAQQKIIVSLCALADRFAGTSVNLNFEQVLSTWKIPYLKLDDNITLS